MDDLEVHPVADLFPMLPPDELRDLAKDIKANGLQHPIVVKDGILIDGRNRLAACELAGVEPAFEEMNGGDPVAYILSSNLARRHMTKGQRAMAGVKAGLLFNSNQRTVADVVGVSRQSVVQAKAVVEYAPDLVDAVLAGTTPLVEGYKVAQDRKKDADSTETQMAELRTEAPDLADQVIDERLTLPEAWAAFRQRKQKRLDDQRDARALLRRIVDLTAPPSASDDFVNSWVSQLGERDDELDPLVDRVQEAAQTMKTLAASLRRLPERRSK